MAKKYKAFSVLFAVFFMSLVVVMMIDGYISSFSAQYIHDDLDKLPDNKCGLLLGTSKYRPEGGINPYFSNRLDAAVTLFRAGKIRYIIASGDNRSVNYNEPRAMMSGLKERGIPAEKIYLDYAGFRTLDSVVRAREIFGQGSITVISQRFHNERAVFIGRANRIDVTGFNAGDNEDSSNVPVRLREVLARFRAFIDVMVLKEEPHFLGEKIVIPDSEVP